MMIMKWHRSSPWKGWLTIAPAHRAIDSHVVYMRKTQYTISSSTHGISHCQLLTTAARNLHLTCDWPGFATPCFLYGWLLSAIKCTLVKKHKNKLYEGHPKSFRPRHIRQRYFPQSIHQWKAHPLLTHMSLLRT